MADERSSGAVGAAIRTRRFSRASSGRRGDRRLRLGPVGHPARQAAEPRRRQEALRRRAPAARHDVPARRHRRLLRPGWPRLQRRRPGSRAQAGARRAGADPLGQPAERSGADDDLRAGRQPVRRRPAPRFGRRRRALRQGRPDPGRRGRARVLPDRRPARRRRHAAGADHAAHRAARGFAAGLRHRRARRLRRAVRRGRRVLCRAEHPRGGGERRIRAQPIRDQPGAHRRPAGRGRPRRAAPARHQGDGQAPRRRGDLHLEAVRRSVGQRPAFPYQPARRGRPQHLPGRRGARGQRRAAPRGRRHGGDDVRGDGDLRAQRQRLPPPGAPRLRAARANLGRQQPHRGDAHPGRLGL